MLSSHHCQGTARVYDFAQFNIHSYGAYLIDIGKPLNTHKYRL